MCDLDDKATYCCFQLQWRITRHSFRVIHLRLAVVAEAILNGDTINMAPERSWRKCVHRNPLRWSVISRAPFCEESEEDPAKCTKISQRKWLEVETIPAGWVKDRIELDSMKMVHPC